VRAVRVVDAVVLGDAVVDVFVDVEYTEDSDERYQVPLAAYGSTPAGGHAAQLATIGRIGEIELVDATTDADACRLLARLTVEAEAAVTTGGMSITGRPVAGIAPGDLAVDLRRSTGEQSNTSVIFGDRAILKLFRRLQEGINPDIEITRALTKAGFAHVPAQHGALELISSHEASTALAVLSAFVADGQDGFVAATAEVDAIAAGRLALDDASVLAAVPDLGNTVAELHAVLRETFGLQQATRENTAARALRIRARAEKTLRQSRAFGLTAGLLDRRNEILARLEALGSVPDLGPLVRIHGDLHLGQALFVDGKRWKLLDFEGEPARPLTERRARSSPLQDVAGMLRSFDYVVGIDPSDVALQWRDRARQQFLHAYLARAGSYGLTPANPAPIIAVFELDKAVYELGYELANRPDWVAIPAAGILRVLDAARSGMSRT
jgi:maltokinase